MKTEEIKALFRLDTNLLKRKIGAPEESGTPYANRREENNSKEETLIIK